MPTPPPEKPRTLREGRYTLLRTLGTGSQGETFEARDEGVVPERPAPGRLVDDWQRYVTRARSGALPSARGLVAVKCFHVRKAKAWKDVELAEREARTLAALEHPNLPRYLEHFEEEGSLYLVMEMIEGESVAAIRARERSSSVAEVERMLRDIGGALRYLHGRAPPVVHRDIKPGNVIRRPDGSYTLVDFGAVRDRLKPEGGSTVVGTFGYMAPEQFQGRASSRSDLYGLAATALVMLTGREPEELPHVGLGIDVANAVPSGASKGLVRALTRMLDPDPDRRISSVDEALELLDARAAPQPASPPASERGERRGKRPPRETKDEKRQRKRAAREEKHHQRAVARKRRPLWRLWFLVGPIVLLPLAMGYASVGVSSGVKLLMMMVAIALPLFVMTLVRMRNASQARQRPSEGDEDAPRVRVEAPTERLRIDTREDEPDDEVASEPPSSAEDPGKQGKRRR